jgi:predicted metal-binding membrane protein
MGFLLAFVFGVMMLGWLVAVLVFLVIVVTGTVSTVGRIINRPGKFLAADAQFLRNLGIRL